MFVPQRAAPVDIGEEQRHRAGWKRLSHWRPECVHRAARESLPRLTYLWTADVLGEWACPLCGRGRGGLRSRGQACGRHLRRGGAVIAHSGAPSPRRASGPPPNVSRRGRRETGEETQDAPRRSRAGCGGSRYVSRVSSTSCRGHCRRGAIRPVPPPNTRGRPAAAYRAAPDRRWCSSGWSGRRENRIRAACDQILDDGVHRGAGTIRIEYPVDVGVVDADQQFAKVGSRTDQSAAIGAPSADVPRSRHNRRIGTESRAGPSYCSTTSRGARRPCGRMRALPRPRRM